jgi:hypothetical protein
MRRLLPVLCAALLAVCVLAPSAGAEMLTCGDQLDGAHSQTSGTFTSVVDCEITAPTSGTAIVLGSSGLGFVDQDYEALLSLGFDEPTAPTFGDPKSRYVNIYGDAGGNGTDKTTTVQSTFPVTAGSHSFYLLALRQSGLGTMSLFDPSISVIFVPDDEPGVEVCSETDGETYLNSTTTFTELAKCTIAAPSAGSVLTLASGSAALSGGAYEANFRLGLDESTTGSAQTDRYINIYPDSGDGTDETVAVNWLTPVTAGTHTMSFIGQRFGSSSGTGTVQVYDPSLIALYIANDAPGAKVCSATGSDTYDNATSSFTTVRGCTLDLDEESDVLAIGGASAAMPFPQGAANEWEGQFSLGVAGGASIDRFVNVYYDGAGGDGTDRTLTASALFQGVPAGERSFQLLGRRNDGTGTVRLFSHSLSVVAFQDAAPPPPPDAPKLIATNPSSPSAALGPRILGSAPAGATVNVYTDASCTTLAATGTAAQLESPGLTVTVAAGSTTTFWATATDGGTSSCAGGTLSYTATAPLAPAAPKLIATTPSSPASDLSPHIVGTADAGSTVRIYTDASCTTLAATGTAAELESPGLQVTVAAGSTTTFWATATGVGTSSCAGGSLTYTANPTPLPGGGNGGGGSGGGAPPQVQQPPSQQPQSTAPAISELRLAPASFVATNAKTPVGASASAAGGTTIRFNLSAPATVRFTMLRDPRRREQPGRRGSPAHKLVRSLGAGPQAVRFSGRLANRILPPASYRLYAVATDSAGTRSEPASAPFRILAP